MFLVSVRGVSQSCASIGDMAWGQDFSVKVGQLGGQCLPLWGGEGSLFTCSAVGLSGQMTNPRQDLLTPRIGVVWSMGDAKL